MIPKIVHYCWFGNTPKNYLANRCVKSFNKLGGVKLLNGMSKIATWTKTIIYVKHTIINYGHL